MDITTGTPIGGRVDKLYPSRRAKENARKRRRSAEGAIERSTAPFVAWDGEGYTDPDGRHQYALFGSSHGERVQNKVLTWRECLPLLFDAPRDAIHVIFAGTYDVTMMFRRERSAQSIMRGEYVTLARGRYKVRFLRSKSLYVKDMHTGESRTLFDVFTFFGQSFVKSCREYLGPEALDTLAAIEDMKELRSTFTEITPEIHAYMQAELDLLVALCDSLRDKLHAADIYPNKWHGPGAIASAVFKAQRITDYMERDIPDDLRTAAESAYYGGRFEQFQRGTFIGPVYQYDIRSAYPHAMRLLPSLSGVQWRFSERGKVREPYALYRINRRSLYGLHGVGVPWRSPWGSIYFPEWANGWYWGIELPAGIPHSGAWEPVGNIGGRPTIGQAGDDGRLRTLQDGTAYGIGPGPFHFVGEFYTERARRKAAGDPSQLALKLALNSGYGKLAQSKGATYDGRKWRKPTYHETLWAGYITAHTRAMINEAVRMAGSSLIAVETDAVFTTEPLSLPIGTELGQWDETRYEGIKYVKSGVHMTLSDGKWSYKTRGVMRRRQNDMSLWERLLMFGEIGLIQTRFGTDPRVKETFAKWYTQTLHVKLDGNPWDKRVRLQVDPTDDYTENMYPLYTPPVPRMPSAPYRFVWNREPDWFDDIIHSMDLEESAPIEMEKA